MLARAQSLLDGWVERHGAALGIVLALLTWVAFVGTVELLVRLVSRTVEAI